MDEEWRPVVGYEDLYSVSNLGRVRRDAPARGAVVGRILRPATRKDGRRSVALWKNCVTETRLVYSLVAEAFVGPCPEGQEINHKNGDCSDDRSANLEYVTHDENVRHAVAMEIHSHKISRAETMEINRRYATGETIANIARSYGVAEPTIQRRISCRRPWRQLTRAEVGEMKKLLSRGSSQRAIARRFGVSPAAVCNIANGKTWRDVV